VLKEVGQALLIILFLKRSCVDGKPEFGAVFRLGVLTDM
jgi:hypothetical protein